jgi:hypothetical protein
MNLKALISSATSNRSIIANRSVSLWWQFFLVFVSFMMISFPFVVGRYDVNQEYLDANFPKFGEHLVLAFESQNCDFTLDDMAVLQLNCPLVDQIIEGEQYTIYILPSESRTFVREAIIFNQDNLIVTRSPEQTLQGRYLFRESTFNQLLMDMNNDEFDVTPQSYGLNYLRNVDLIALPTDLWFIYISIAIQYSLYLLVITTLIWWLYAKRGSIKLKFKEVTGMLVLIMFWTALPTAVLGFFSPVLASVLFTIGYVTRIIFMYTKLTREIRV